MNQITKGSADILLEADPAEPGKAMSELRKALKGRDLYIVAKGTESGVRVPHRIAHEYLKMGYTLRIDLAIDGYADIEFSQNWWPAPVN